MALDAPHHGVGRMNLGVAFVLLAVGAVAGGRAVLHRCRVAARLVPVPAPGRRRRGRVHRSPAGADAVATLPEVVDLLAVAAAAGLPPAGAVAAVTRWVPEPWSAALGRCVAAAERTPLADALGHLPLALGDAARPLVGVLQAGLADGGTFSVGLRSLAADARDLRRRRAEEQARRIPVRLLLPLVACSLPAFAVLTIVPILAGALRGLRLPS